MIDKDVALAKIASIQKCLKRIKKVTRLEASSLDNIDVQDIFVLNLQRAIQSTVDLAIHLIVKEGWELPDTIKKNFVILADNSIIDRDLVIKLQKMVGFRNIAVHDYESSNPEILKNILQNHYKRFRRILQKGHQQISIELTFFFILLSLILTIQLLAFSCWLLAIVHKWVAHPACACPHADRHERF